MYQEWGLGPGRAVSQEEVGAGMGAGWWNGPKASISHSVQNRRKFNSRNKAICYVLLLPKRVDSILKGISKCPW